MRATTRRAGALTGVLVMAGMLTACAEEPAPTASVAPSASVTPPATSTPTPSPTPTASAEPVEDLGALVPSGDPQPLASGLAAPWSIAVLADGSVLVSERDTARIVEIVDGQVVPVTAVPGVAAAGEGGLMGLAALEDASGSWLYAMHTAADDNRVVRMPLAGTAGAHTLGAPEEVLTGLPRAANHNGGRIAFGPDGMLYVTAGDASTGSYAQELSPLGGKILRVTPEGAVPADNPFPGSPTWSLGHRNPQGIGWAADGTMWAAEFGQNTWDELNVIVPGGNYGWPIVEGRAGDPNLIDPVQQWATDDASPSGIAVVGDTVFMAALGGERLWSVGFDGAAAEWYGGGQLGRVRDVVRGPGSSLYLITNNTDGRGDPRAGDDVLYRIDLVPAG
ncbi:PQQ-dependent sugar dehydrogenase [Herbiconiux moechotypicola]|uniref:PQQ-dependent sugar dehydrogenase n=1 Tax=Herbiconiux moechotypicola TaxID=637393 RepID=A0ABN3DTQ6_9MICO|nr:PQQ-dependent sugar dehydrogenase [Herbiconiux moechotypicola]MCS5730515.1 PQQ-dependent sugar dehydrogenase [Herbiconiux moechotypicola]